MPRRGEEGGLELGLLAIDGVSEQPLWEQTFSDSESYSSPTLGFFDDDPVPDLFVTFLRGQFPEYSGALHAIVAGRDGAILWQAEAGNLSMAGDVAADLDGDGIDEVIFMAGDTGAAQASTGTKCQVAQWWKSCEGQTRPKIALPIAPAASPV